MQNLSPNKLKSGDEIRVVAPSIGIKIIGNDCREIAKERFEKMGLKVSFAKNTNDENFDAWGTSEIKQRAEDINQAFADKNVKAVFSIIGGFNSNAVLPYLDYEIIKQNPKIVCGFSDITALLNGIRAKTGLITFYGPHYSSMGMKKGCEYTCENLQQVLFTGKNEIKASDEWSDDLWFLDQENRQMIKNEGIIWLKSGEAKGIIEGGNLGTYTLLAGTEYQPQFKQDTILMIEDCFTAESADIKYFMRQLQALAQRDDFKKVKAILVGRFQKASKVATEQIEYIRNNIPQIKDLPMAINLDFGHTTPINTIPLGGNCEIKNNKIMIEW